MKGGRCARHPPLLKQLSLGLVLKPNPMGLELNMKKAATPPRVQQDADRQHSHKRGMVVGEHHRYT